MQRLKHRFVTGKILLKLRNTMYILVLHKYHRIHQRTFASHSNNKIFNVKYQRLQAVTFQIYTGYVSIVSNFSQGVYTQKRHRESIKKI